MPYVLTEDTKQKLLRMLDWWQRQQPGPKVQPMERRPNEPMAVRCVLREELHEGRRSLAYALQPWPAGRVVLMQVYGLNVRGTFRVHWPVWGTITDTIEVDQPTLVSQTLEDFKALFTGWTVEIDGSDYPLIRDDEITVWRDLTGGLWWIGFQQNYFARAAQWPQSAPAPLTFPVMPPDSRLLAGDPTDAKQGWSIIDQQIVGTAYFTTLNLVSADVQLRETLWVPPFQEPPDYDPSNPRPLAEGEIWVTPAVPLPNDSPLRAGAICWAEWRDGIGWVVTAGEAREFRPWPES